MSKKDLSHESFLRLLLQYEDDLRAYARALMPTWEAVDDVLQESSIVMWRKLDQLQDKSEFLPWAKVIVRFEVLRSRQKVARDRLCFSEKTIELLAADDFATDAEVIAQERHALSRCLEKFDPAQRELILLPYRSHGAVSDLANKTNRTANSLYKKAGRLRAKLAQCIDAKMADLILGGLQ